MKRSHYTPLLISLVVIGLGASLFLLMKRDAVAPSGSTVDNMPIRQALQCGRKTADYRVTDPLCTNTDYARQLFTHGITFGADVPGAGAKLAGNVLVLMSGGEKARPLARTHVKVSVETAVQCIQAPCNPVTHPLADAATDELGIIQLPELPSSTDPLATLVVEADGHTLKREPVMTGGSDQYLVRLED